MGLGGVSLLWGLMVPYILFAPSAFERSVLGVKFSDKLATFLFVLQVSQADSFWGEHQHCIWVIYCTVHVSIAARLFIHPFTHPSLSL